jgi:hypothetical protein
MCATGSTASILGTQIIDSSCNKNIATWQLGNRSRTQRKGIHIYDRTVVLEYLVKNNIPGGWPRLRMILNWRVPQSSVFEGWGF